MQRADIIRQAGENRPKALIDMEKQDLYDLMER